jgi:hypothetical protein
MFAKHHDTSEMTKISMKMTWGRIKKLKELLQWYMRERKKDVMLHHPANGIQWRNFDWKHKDFAVEVRNIRFGLSIDGMNHFGETDSSHSTWHVTLCIYNLPS